MIWRKKLLGLAGLVAAECGSVGAVVLMPTILDVSLRQTRAIELQEVEHQGPILWVGIRLGYIRVD
jgi:hypothetical protein